MRCPLHKQFVHVGQVAGQEGSPVFLDASQLEDLASALGSVSLTPTLQATSRSASTTPQSSMGAIASFMPTPTDGETSGSSEIPISPLSRPIAMIRAEPKKVTQRMATA